MRWRVIFGLSLIANLVLALGWFWFARTDSSPQAVAPGTTNTLTSTNTRTAVLVRRQFFSWRELESRDYPTYIKNLREIGCPEQTIRDIIIADVTQMLREKYLEQSLRLNPNPKWWTNLRDQRDQTVFSNQANPANAMWTERDGILKQLLGADWAVRGPVSPAQTNNFQAYVLATLDISPALQGLAADKKQIIAALLNDPASSENSPSAEKARWAKLSEVLTVEQLEAAKLYFSAHAQSLRDQLDGVPGFETQPEEFRKIFRATETIDEQIALLSTLEDPGADPRFNKLLAERDAAIRAALTPARYEQYVRLQDPAYLSAMETLANGGNPAALSVLYAINREATTELERIQNDPTLTETQRQIELKRLELEQLKATAQALGEQLLDESTAKETPPKPEPKKIHTVAGGEGLDRIARLYGIDPNALRAANPNVNFDKLQAGTPISVPLRLIHPLPPPSE